MMSPTISLGLSEAYGSWKIIWTKRRIGRSSARDKCAISTVRLGAFTGSGVKRIDPSVGFSARTMQRAAVVLPQPLSPTSASVSPCAMAISSPATARTRRTRSPISGRVRARIRWRTGALACPTLGAMPPAGLLA